MCPPVRITTPIPSVEEVAKTLGVSPRRMKELVDLAHELAADGDLPKRVHASRQRKKGKTSHKR